ncbi:MAG: hypothetical protein WC975_05505 [Phycisphaerae bacterium]
MSIRFLCQNCHKPLEVDDADAGNEALCFFCRSRNTAPQQSDPTLATAQLAPELFTSSRPAKSPVIGIIGLIASLTMLAVITFTVVWSYKNGYLSAMQTDNYTSLSKTDRQKVINKKMAESAKQPIMQAASLTFIALLIFGLGFSVAGLATRSGKSPALAGLIISLLVVLLLIFSIISTLKRPPG